MNHAEKLDAPESFEEHFAAAYLVAVEGCDVVRHRVPHTERKHADLAALGYSSKARRYIGCDVLDWFDRGWPRVMNPDKVLPKLQERVELFGRRVSLEEAGERSRTAPRKRFVFFGFSPLSPRLITALPGVGTPSAVETITIRGESLREAVRSAAAFALSPAAPLENHFVRSVRLLVDSGWMPGTPSNSGRRTRIPRPAPGEAAADEPEDR